jgi:predicted metalloprotease with PDZ domain
MNAQSLNRTDALNCLPVRNPAVSESRQETTGEVILSYPVKIKPWIRIFQRHAQTSDAPCQTRKLQLDILGTHVWDMIDGTASVLDISAAFAAAHRLNDREAEISVTLFLRELGRREIIGMKPNLTSF